MISPTNRVDIIYYFWSEFLLFLRVFKYLLNLYFLSFFAKYKNYVITFGTEIFILILSFVIFRIANERMSDISFSEYTLSRRNISFLQPLLMIGLGVAVPRYVSIYLKEIRFCQQV